jgi:ABC-type amino acid transport system permease subunit
METYTTIAAMYFIVLFTASSLARFAERRLSRVG